jgi:hypothetical protein
MRKLNKWEEVTGKLADVRSEEEQTLITVGDVIIRVTDLSDTELKKSTDTEISIIRTESGYRWFRCGDDQ